MRGGIGWTISIGSLGGVDDEGCCWTNFSNWTEETKQILRKVRALVSVREEFITITIDIVVYLYVGL